MKRNKFSLSGPIGTIAKAAMLALLVAAFAVVAFSQDDVELTGKVIDSGGHTIGKADLIQRSGDASIMFDYYIKMWLDGGKLRIVRPGGGKRSTTIECSYREYTVDPAHPTDQSKWNETGSGTATLKMQPTGELHSINVSTTKTKKVVGDNDVDVNEPPQKFVIRFD